MSTTDQALDLDAIAAWFEGKTENPDTLQDVSEWHAVRDLIAKVRQAERERDEARAALDRVKAASRHPCKGPDDTDASMLRAAAKRLRGGYEPGGSWTKQTVAAVIEAVAAAIEAP